MYICISNTGYLRAGDIIILQKNVDFGEVTASVLGGGVVGFITDIQPEGCMNKTFAETKIGNRKVIGRAVVVNGNVALLSIDSPVFGSSTRRYAAASR